jgi:hypothetical protein
MLIGCFSSSESGVPGKAPSRGQRCERRGAASAPGTAIKPSVESMPGTTQPSYRVGFSLRVVGRSAGSNLRSNVVGRIPSP